jgi:hypothetical protein
MAKDTWNAHISYLEDEVKKIDERADKLEEMGEHLEAFEPPNLALSFRISWARKNIRVPWPGARAPRRTFDRLNLDLQRTALHDCCNSTARAE